MMKARDVAIATSLIIQGFHRANVEAQGADPLSDHAQLELRNCLGAIRQECHDWAENLKPKVAEPSAVEPHEIGAIELSEGGAPIERTPYNLVSAAIALMIEATDLAGAGAMADFEKRLAIAQPDADGPEGAQPKRPLMATYEMPHFTTRTEAEAIAKPHRAEMVSWVRTRDGSGNHLATFRAPGPGAFEGMSQDLSYNPIAMGYPGAD